jgi:hypothetical protein
MHRLHTDRPKPFDMRVTRIRFQVMRRFLGRGAAHDAAGRAGSLRGPRRVFFYALWTLLKRLPIKL